eukprot:3744658-Rhodomonas_salina.1
MAVLAYALPVRCLVLTSRTVLLACLRAPCAMWGTDTATRAICLCADYAIVGMKCWLGFAATRCPVLTWAMLVQDVQY